MVRSKPSRSANGFILEPVLVLFILALLFSAYVSSAIYSRGHLIQAARRNSLDLAIIEQAKYIAAQSAWYRRCQIEQSEPVDLSCKIQNTEVRFVDRTTLIECSYHDQQKSYRIEVFYDQSGIIKVEFGA